MLCGCGKTGKIDGVQYRITEGGHAQVVGVDASVTHAVIAAEFQGCPVTEIGSMAFANAAVESVTIPDSVTSILSEAFRNSALREVSVPDSVTFLGSGAFSKCSKLESVILPAGLECLNFGMFWESGVKRIELPDGLKEIQERAFSQCANLSELQLPEGIERIGEYAFSESGLTDVALPATLISLGKCAFENCASLKKVTLPDSISTLWGGTFSGCAALEEVLFVPGAKEVMSDLGVYNAFEGCPSLASVELPGNAQFREKQPDSLCFVLRSADSVSEWAPNFTFAEGMDIRKAGLWDAVMNGELSCSPYANGIDTFVLTMTNETDDILYVDFTAPPPTGLYLLCESGSYQDMLITKIDYPDTDPYVDPRGTFRVFIDTACMNLHRDVPHGETPYKLERLPVDSLLLRLLGLFEAEGCSYSVRQAAVWIVTDNAGFADTQLLRNAITTLSVISRSDYDEAESLVKRAKAMPSVTLGSSSGSGG